MSPSDYGLSHHGRNSSETLGFIFYRVAVYHDGNNEAELVAECAINVPSKL